MGIFDFLFGGGKKAEHLKELLNNGAIVIDVRTKGEFSGSHVPKSINIPLDKLNSSLGKIKGFKKPIILCCASGARSGQAVNFLKHEGVACENGGSWAKVNRLLNQ